MFLFICFTWKLFLISCTCEEHIAGAHKKKAGVWQKVIQRYSFGLLSKARHAACREDRRLREKVTKDFLTKEMSVSASSDTCRRWNLQLFIAVSLWMHRLHLNSVFKLLSSVIWVEQQWGYLKNTKNKNCCNWIDDSETDKQWCVCGGFLHMYEWSVWFAVVQTTNGTC